MHHKIPGRLWESVEDDLFSMDNKYYLNIEDYNKKFLVVKQAEGFSGDNLTEHVRLFVSQNFKIFCK